VLESSCGGPDPRAALCPGLSLRGVPWRRAGCTSGEEDWTKKIARGESRWRLMSGATFADKIIMIRFSEPQFWTPGPGGFPPGTPVSTQMKGPLSFISLF